MPRCLWWSFLNRTCIKTFEKGKVYALIGANGSGKTTFGKKLAKSLGRKFYDADDVLEAREKRTIKSFFAESEAAFRAAETRTLKYLADMDGVVIATGGGAVVKEVNRKALKENGIIVYIERDIDKLDITNRPVSKNRNLKELFEERRGIYEGFADIKIKNDTTPKDCSDKIINELKKYKTETRRSTEKTR